MMQPDKLPDYVLLVVPESLTKTVNYHDRGTAAVLWGDGAAAAVVSTRHRGRARILGQHPRFQPRRLGQGVRAAIGGHFEQQGRTVQTFGIKRMNPLPGGPEGGIRDGCRAASTSSDIRRTSACSSRPAGSARSPPNRHHTNVEWFGNTGCASSASVISMNWEKWTEVDDIGLVGVGSGSDMVQLPASLRGRSK